MAYVIFDLDGTVIDSSHRHLSKPDGSIDLDHWFENATPEKVAQDGLLPLIHSMRAIHAAGHTVLICTARTMQPQDWKFLVDNDVPYHVALYRQPGDSTPDGVLKAQQLEEYFRNEGFTCAREANAIMFDDNLKVIAAMKAIGINCLNATSVNHSIGRRRARREHRRTLPAIAA